jgi:protein O-mannosyl-transferase
MSNSPTTIVKQYEACSGMAGFLGWRRGSRRVVLSFLLALITLGVYHPVLRNQFTTLDDGVYISQNPHVCTGLKWETVKWAFAAFDTGNWHPLTWLSLALDCKILGPNPAGIHFENVVLHGLNAALLFLLLESCTGCTWPSLMVAALFALHPMNVESVAWAAERKNVLSMTFFLLAMLAYGGYVKQGGGKRYAAVAGLYALGLMAKPEIITLPFVLLLWDYWPLQRMSKPSAESAGRPAGKSFWFLFFEKLPLVAVSLGSAIVTVVAARASDAVRNGFNFARIGNALLAYVRYVGKAFWPSRLAVMYLYRGDSIPAWAVFSSAALLVAVTGVAVCLRRHRYLMVGWFWFLGTLVPVIGVVAVGRQSMADRYAYLPFVGLFTAVVWGAQEVAQWRGVVGNWLAAPSVAILLGLGMVTQRQISYWHDGEAMWRRTISVTARNAVAHDGLAYVLTKQGRVDDAISEYKKVEELHGYSAPAIVQVGIYEQTHGYLWEAAAQYKLSLAMAVDAGEQSDAYAHLGTALGEMGDFADERMAYAYALQGNPRNTLALTGVGLMAERAGDWTTGLALIDRALEVERSDVNLLLLAQALRQTGRLLEADAAEQEAQRVSSNFEQARKSAAQQMILAGIAPQ